MENRKATEADKLLGKRLRELRQARGMTLDDLSQASGVSYQQIQKYEAGRNRIPATRLVAFANVLDATIGMMFASATIQSPDNDELLCRNPNEISVLRAIRSLPIDQRNTCAKFMEMIASAQSAG